MNAEIVPLFARIHGNVFDESDMWRAGAQRAHNL
jgi:isocitrate dehydrogenase kinase/phosphatase